jgi:hypothetical protein
LRAIHGEGGIFIDCGSLEIDQYRQSGKGYPLEYMPVDEPGSRWVMAISEKEGQSVEYSIPVDHKSQYKIYITYTTPSLLPIKQQVVCGNQVIDANVYVKPGEVIQKNHILTPDFYSEGSIVLTFSPEEGCFAGVCELLIEHA